MNGFTCCRVYCLRGSFEKVPFAAKSKAYGHSLASVVFLIRKGILRRKEKFSRESIVLTVRTPCVAVDFELLENHVHVPVVPVATASSFVVCIEALVMPGSFCR